MDNTPPIEPEYDPIEEIEAALRASAADRLEELVHPVAEQFVNQFDGQPITEGLSLPVLKLSGCVSEAAARRLFGHLLTNGISKEHYLALMTLFQLGWKAHEQWLSGRLDLPQGG